MNALENLQRKENGVQFGNTTFMSAWTNIGLWNSLCPNYLRHFTGGGIEIRRAMDASKAIQQAILQS